MSNFTLEDTEDFDIEIDLSSLSTGRKTREKREPRSLQELKVHYLNFCANRDLDSSIPPEEQISYCEKDQMWLDAHVNEVRNAQRQKRLYARGKTQLLRNMLIAIKQKTQEDEEAVLHKERENDITFVERKPKKKQIRKNFNDSQMSLF